ncbi:hypothetical protein pb186bvf_014539 [Paramecium bursaria]
MVFIELHQNLSQVPASQPTLDKQQKVLYAQQLQQQIEMKKLEKLNQQQFDRLQDVKMMVEGGFGSRVGGGGAPIRDEYGNILTTRRNPHNPNFQSEQWQKGQIMQPPILQDSMVSQQLQRSQVSMPQLSVIPEVNSSAYFQSNIAEEEKRLKQRILQRELQQQMEDKERKKREAKEQEKRDKEYDDQRVVMERQLMERRMREELNTDKLESRNLNETNFDIDQQKHQKRMEYLKYQSDLIEQQNRKNARTVNGKRPRTPVNEAEKSFRDLQNDQFRERIEQRIIRELPFEVEKTVQNTINVELQRLRQEMNLSTNQVSEQIVQLKGQLLRANDARHQGDEQIRRLKEELKQTQIIDEIRQRELYQAFLNQEKTRQIIESTQRLQTPDTIKFTFPRRPRPYYNMSDPYLGTNDDVNRDLHHILTDNTRLMPLKSDYEKDQIEDKMLYNRNEIREDAKRGYRIDQNLDLPDDYLNRQQLYMPKKYLDQNPTNNYNYDEFDRYPISLATQTNKERDIIQIIGQKDQLIEEEEIKDVIQRYDSKLEKLDQIDFNKNNYDFALQDLLEQQKNKINRIDQFKEHFEYNDYYSPDYQETHFYDKLNKIYS